MFTIDSIREKLAPEEFTGLETLVNDLTGQRDAARQESIAGRRSLKTEVETLRSFRAAVIDRLGLDDDATPDTLPDVRATTDAAKVLEARVKRLETELSAAKDENANLIKSGRDKDLSVALSSAIAGHDFVDADLVSTYVRARISFDDEGTPVYKTDDGKMLPLAEGVKVIAATKPHLLKAAGAGGSGYNHGNGSGATKKWTEMTLTERGELYKKDPAAYERLKTQGT